MDLTAPRSVPTARVYVCNNGGFEWRDRDGCCAGRAARRLHGGRIERVDLATGRFERVYETFDGGGCAARTTSCSIAPAASGSPTSARASRVSAIVAALFYARATARTCIAHVHPAVSFNGVGLSPDEKVVYCNDTETQKLWAFDIAEPGKLAPPLRSANAAAWLCSAARPPALDSLAVEANGNVCSATLFNGGITIFAPDGRSSTSRCRIR